MVFRNERTTALRYVDLGRRAHYQSISQQQLEGRAVVYRVRIADQALEYGDGFGREFFEFHAGRIGRVDALSQLGAAYNS